MRGYKRLKGAKTILTRILLELHIFGYAGAQPRKVRSKSCHATSTDPGLAIGERHPGDLWKR